MAKFGCPPRFIAMVRQFHYGMQARVQNDGELSEPFEVTNGVKQGCVIVPRLFEEKWRDIIFGFPSFRPSVLPSFRPPIGVCTLCKQLLLQFYSDSFETLQMSHPGPSLRTGN